MILLLLSNFSPANRPNDDRQVGDVLAHVQVVVFTDASGHKDLDEDRIYTGNEK